MLVHVTQPVPIAAFAEGGYVTGPTNAIIGEGGDSEYVIPSKMDEVQAIFKRHAWQQRHPNSADVTVNYNGSMLIWAAAT